VRALVVVESMFGNTQTVARAIADGLGTRLDVHLVGVGRAPAAIPPDLDLLVVGGPTHAFGMSRPSTRQAAAQQGGTTVTPVEAGLREWLDHLAGPTGPLVAATFDTRIRKHGIPGSAARGAAKRLDRLGIPLLAPPTSFWVTDTPGPLVEGEVARARHWGEDLAIRLATPVARKVA
jgi:hypothetical protein